MLSLKTANLDDIEHIMFLEEQGFEPGLTECEETFLKRINTFADGFFMALHPDENHRPVGYFSSELWDRHQRKDHSSFDVGHDILDYHSHDGTSLYVSSMTIHPDFQSKGLGRFLFTSSIHQLIKKYPQQIREVILMVNVGWNNAINIYKSEGFEEVDRITGIFTPLGAEPQDAMIMTRIISNDF